MDVQFSDQVTFDRWFKELLTIAKERDALDLIDRSDPTTYMDYFDDGDTPEDAFDAEWEARDTDMKDHE